MRWRTRKVGTFFVATVLDASTIVHLTRPGQREFNRLNMEIYDFSDILARRTTSAAL